MSEMSRISGLAGVILVVLVAAAVAALTRQVGPPSAPVSVARAAAERPRPLPDAVPLSSGSRIVTLSRPAEPGGGAILYLHGGGWSGGRADEVLPGLDLAHHVAGGWTVLSLDYRLASRGAGVDAGDQVDDVTEALRWLDASGPAHGLPGAVVVVGHSAGAHLASVAAARPGPAPDAVVGVAGVYDTAADVRSNPMLAPVLPDAIGCDRCPDGLPAPSRWATDDDPPVHLVHGDIDPIAPVASAERYADALRSAGVTTTIAVVDGGGHDGVGIRRVTRDVLDQLLAAVERSSR